MANIFFQQNGEIVWEKDYPELKQIQLERLLEAITRQLHKEGILNMYQAHSAHIGE